MSSYLFTSESVAAGHPDKMADQISDAVLDALLRETEKQGKSLKDVRCACETMVKTGMVIVAGEVRSKIMVDIEKIVRDVVNKIGYNNKGDWGFNGNDCAVMNAIGAQSADIAQGVDKGKKKRIGAGDQGMMFGYACRETESLMPLPIELSHQLMRQHEKMRLKKLTWLGPDAKAQVSVEYKDGKPNGIKKLVLSSQHMKNKKIGEIRESIMEHIIHPTLHRYGLPSKKDIHINPTGRFVDGGPKADCGLTGRKIIVDTYGGAAPHGGGAFSGKDPTKVDRSAAYMARYIAKNIVAAKLADKCLVQLAYAIGVAEPVSVMVDTYNTSKKSAEALQKGVQRVFKLTPEDIINTFDLWRPIYQPTATYGHFGRKEFPWEKTDKVDELRRACKAVHP